MSTTTPGAELAPSGTETETGSETETVTLANGLTCAIPASSPLAKLLKSQRTWVGPSAKERLPRHVIDDSDSAGSTPVSQAVFSSGRAPAQPRKSAR